MNRQEYNRRYYSKNKDRIKATILSYRNKNRKKIATQQGQYYKENKERILERQKIWTRKFYAEHKDIHKKRNRERWVKYRREMYEKLGGKKCVHCGFSDERALAIDHVFDDGFKERKKLKSISQMRRAVLLKPERYQVLCYNCNQIKRYEKESVAKKK